VNASTRALWLALMVFFSLIVGLLAGGLTRAGGANLSSAVLKGGASVGGTLLVLLAVAYFVTDSH
jgi:hypothetical protein